MRRIINSRLGYAGICASKEGETEKGKGGCVTQTQGVQRVREILLPQWAPKDTNGIVWSFRGLRRHFKYDEPTVTRTFLPTSRVNNTNNVLIYK